jgi:bacteriocin-like protein
MLPGNSAGEKPNDNMNTLTENDLRKIEGGNYPIDSSWPIGDGHEQLVYTRQLELEWMYYLFSIAVV